MLVRSVRQFLGESPVAPALLKAGPRCLSAVGGSAPLNGSESFRDGTSSGSRERNSSERFKWGGLGATTLVASGLGVAWYLHGKGTGDSGKSDLLRSPLLQLAASSGDSKDGPKISVRERRYKDFASIRYKGQPYMTPRDFLESVTIDEPRRKPSSLCVCM